MEDYWKIIRCSVDSIDEKQEQWDQDGEWRQQEESGKMDNNFDKDKEIPSEAQLNQEKKFPEQEMSIEAQLGETDNELRY